MAIFKNLCQQMFVYNSLLFSQHDFDSIMFRIQLPIAQKFNQNVMMGNLPLNLKQTYQTSFVRPSSLFLFRAYPKQNIL
jgi:hypothetical protein